jgi:hypothetical protein
VSHRFGENADIHLLQRTGDIKKADDAKDDCAGARIAVAPGG